MKTLSLIAVAVSSILATQAYAVDAPQQLDCMVAQAKTGGWNESIVLTNQCGRTIEMQNSLLQFQTNQNLRGGFWGQLSPLAWPAQTELSSQQVAGGYLTSIPLKFPVGNQWWKPNSKLPAGKSITLTFSGNPQTTINDIAFYPVAPPPPAQKGQLILKLPANPAGDSAVKPDIVVSGGNGYQMNITDAKWQQDFVLPDVPYGQYAITVKSLEHNDQMWTGKGVPQSLFLNQAEGTVVNVQYELVPAKGGIALQIAQAMPEANLAQPVVHVRDLNTGQDIKQVALNWNQTQVVSGLLANQNYALRADNIAGKWHEYHPTFLDTNPVNVKANQNVPARIQYQAIPIVSTMVNANVSGLPEGKNGKITVVDNLGHQFSQTLANGQKELWNLPANRQYNVSVVSFQHDGVTYRAKVTPSSFMLEKSKPITLNIAYEASNDNADFVAYWAGWSNYQLDDLAQTKVDVVNLSFANILADGVGYKVDTGVSGYLTDVPRSGSQMWPNYVTWTKYAYEHPETKMMLSVGGATFSAIWRNLLNANNVEAIAQVIVNKLNTQFPVYAGNFANPQEQIGTVALAGVDLDVEAGGRLSPQITDNIVALVKAIKRLAPDKLVTFAGFSVGADPEGACTVPGSIHCGETRDLLQKIGNEFDWINVMAYDAGLDYANTRYKEAMDNYADLVGKEKVFLGINTKPHWGVSQPESVALISEKTDWTFDNDFGGVMVWVIDNYQRPDGNDIYGILNIMSNAMPQ